MCGRRRITDPCHHPRADILCVRTSDDDKRERKKEREEPPILMDRDGT